MRVAWVLVATTACAFDHGVLGPTDASVDPSAADASRDAPLDSPTDAHCDPADPTLIACYPFEGNAQDVSGNNLHALTQNVTFVAGKRGMAMQVDVTSAADVPESPLLDPSALTIEAWIQPSVLPAAGLRAGIVDNNGQWGLFVHENGRLRCTVGSVSMEVDAGIATTAWTHVACTYDGATATLYVGGVLAGQGIGGGMLGTGGTTGISIAADNPPGAGSHLTGLIDELQLYAVARSAADICKDAGCTP